MKKLGWKGALGFAISGLLIWYTLKDESASEIWANIRDADFLLLGGAVFIGTFGFFIRALRWKVLLTPVDPNTGLRARFAAVNIGFMANNLLPARMGEFARAISFAKLQPTVTASAAFGSLVVERVLDGLVLAAMLVVTVLSPGFPDIDMGDGFTTLLKTIVTLLGGVAVFLIVLLAFPNPVVRAMEKMARLLPAKVGDVLVEALEAFMESLEVVKSPRLLGLALLWSVGFWIWHGFSFYLGMLAFDIDIGLVAAFFTEAAVGFGVAVPAAPGFFGTFHATVQFALEDVYRVEAAKTLAFAYGYHMGGFIPVTLIGLWYARQIGMSLTEVGHADEELEVELAEDFGDRVEDDPVHGHPVHGHPVNENPVPKDSVDGTQSEHTDFDNPRPPEADR